MPPLTTVTTTLACECEGTRVYDLRGWNVVDKPVVECRDCETRVVGPLGMMKPSQRERARRLADTEGSR
jgi:hypothetical protein